jgi:hypothetical protein
VWTLGVVFLAILLTENSRFEQVTEDFSAEEFVPESTVEAFDVEAFDVEAFDVAVFPGSTRSDEPSFDVKMRQVAPDRIGEKLGAVVTSDEGRRSALGNEIVQNIDDIR